MSRSPKVVYVTAGGAGMYCGSCMRDNTLASTLHRMGVPVTLVPTFTPIRTDEESVSIDRVFLGGINLYLEQKWPVFRRLPRVLRRALDHPALLKGLSRMSLQRRKSEDGEMAVSLLQGEEGPHAAEIRDLVAFIADDLRPDVINLTNLLIAGFVPALKRRRDLPVVVTLQGDDIFLDSLDPGSRTRVVAEMKRVARSVDGFVVFNSYYRDCMAALLDIPLEKFHIVPLGLADLHSFQPVGPGTGPGRPPTVGYLARICPEKGFHRLVDAFLQMRRKPGMEHARLRAAGWLGASDREFFDRERRRLLDDGADFQRIEIDDRPSKIAFLSQLDILSVPSVYREPKGLYVLEALAAGVPVVLPSHGAFPEILAGTGGGKLVPPDDPDALAGALFGLLTEPAERRRLSEEGLEGVRRRHPDEAMARETLRVWERLIDGRRHPGVA